MKMKIIGLGGGMHFWPLKSAIGSLVKFDKDPLFYFRVIESESWVLGSKLTMVKDVTRRFNF